MMIFDPSRSSFETVCSDEMLTINLQERAFALKAARSALTAFLAGGAEPMVRTDSPALLQLRGSFTTLRRRDTGELRGCRGECRPTRPLIESVIQQTITSATDDFRFSPVTVEEVARLTIRISALTPLQRIEPEAIELGRHGLVVVKGRQSGLLLPEVPAHFGIQTIDEFLDAVYRKAQLDPRRVSDDDVELYSFETEAWDDHDSPDLSDFM
jgi:AmmeMemoRadiSam system protein A